ncbi:MAG: sugar phosphate isomerase/epimerase [Lachnospiraceae bacterium]|nr:sugar phosphate isomerase/epimerase [Candidatus Minthocola equi]
MQIGIYYAYWEKEWGGDFLPYVKKVKDLGFDILEVATGGFAKQNEDYFRVLKQAADDNGIILTGGYGPEPAYDLSSDNPAVVAAGFEKYKDMFKKMSIAGIHWLGGGLYSYWPVDFGKPFDKPAALERSIKNMRTLADMAADYDICLGMESLNRFEGYLLNTSEETRAYVDAVDRKNVYVMLDTFHMNIEEDSMADAIRTAGPRLGHFHVGEANRRPPRAESRIPWEEIAKALKEINYQGALVMEPFVRMEGQVGKDIHMWHDLSNGCPDSVLDKDAADSVVFLRSIFE